jgi:hypothetical protein
MADKLDLTTNEIPAAIDGALLRGRQPALAYVNADGDPSVSFRGSTHVHGPGQLALWIRKTDSGLVKAIVDHPHVHVVYFGGHDGPGPAYLSFRGSARVDPSANDKVYEAIPEPEQKQDPDRNGVAVIIDVESLDGFAPATGPFHQEA